MGEKLEKFKETVAFCGTRALTVAGIAAAGLAVASPFIGVPPAAVNTTATALFAAATVLNRSAQKTGNKNKPQGLKNLQSKLVMGSLLAFAVITGSSEIVEDRARVEEAGKQPYTTVVATGRPDPDWEKRQNMFAEGKTVRFEDLMAIAGKTSAKDLNINDGKEISSDKKISISILQVKKESSRS